MANFNFNKVILGGRLTADPELKTTPSGVSVTVFTIAVNRNYKAQDEKQTANFFNVIAWRATAEFITRYFRKASSICLVGSLQSRSWTDQQGQKHFGTEIVADEAFFVDALRESPMGRNNSDVIVDGRFAQSANFRSSPEANLRPNSPALAGIDPGAAPGKVQAQMYATPGARGEIAQGMAEDDGELPF